MLGITEFLLAIAIVANGDKHGKLALIFHI